MMKYRTWTGWVLSFMLTPVIGVALLNYIIDPFSIFHSHFLKYDYELNERFNKVRAIEKNHTQFNAYLFGSSRSGTTSPALLNQYFPGHRFYNFFLSGANQYDHELILRYLIRQQYEIKTIFLQIDISDIYGYGAPSENYHAKHHPHVTHSSMALYYLSYLTVLPIERMLKKIRVNFFNEYQSTLKYDIQNSGQWLIDHLDRKMIMDPLGYIANEPSFHVLASRSNKGTKIAQNIEALKRFKQLADANHIQLVVYIAPHHQQMMNTFHAQSYLDYLTLIAQIVPYWDFSGYNDYTTNHSYYYESSHYTSLLATLILKKIFKDDPHHEIASNFGQWVDMNNIKSHIKQRKKEMTKHDNFLQAQLSNGF